MTDALVIGGGPAGLAAAEVVVGLAIIVAIFRWRTSANVDELAELKG